MCKKCTFIRTLSCNSWRHRPTYTDFETVKKWGSNRPKLTKYFLTKNICFSLPNTKIDSLLWNVGFWSISRLTEKHLFMSKPHRVLRLSILSGFNCLFVPSSTMLQPNRLTFVKCSLLFNNKTDWQAGIGVYASNRPNLDHYSWLLCCCCCSFVSSRLIWSNKIISIMI